MHEPTAPTQNEHGDDVHPAFGFIQAHRITSTPGSVLFDSEIVHTHFVRVTLGRMSRKRDLKRDWLHPTSRLPLVEVDMSEAQWAQFVSSMNSSATPCTLRSTESNYDVAGLEFAPRLAISAAETREAAHEAFDDIKAAMAAFDALDSKTPAKEKKAVLARLRATINNATPNVEFAAKSLREHTEDVVTKARADVEAMVVHKAQSLGIEPSQLGALQIEAGPAEDDPGYPHLGAAAKRAWSGETP